MNSNSPRQPVVMVVLSGTQAACHRGVARYAQERGWHLLYDSLYTGSIPAGCRLNGVIVGECGPGVAASAARSLLVPCVALNPEVFGTEGGCSVCSDNDMIGAMAAEHFLERGFRHFAWAPSLDDGRNRTRMLSFETALREFGHEVHSLPPAFHLGSGLWLKLWELRREEIAGALSGLPRGTGILAYNDCVASELIRICRECGLKVPGDIAVLGIDNDPLYGDNTAVPLSSVELDFEEIGFQAARLLDQFMTDGVASERPVRVPPKGVVSRLSTGARLVGDARVRDALKYIFENYMNPALGVQDVANAAGVSRRALERAFLQSTGVTVSEYVARTRMQEAARLLRTHDRAKVFDVAELVGFGGQTNFFRRFRRHFGVTPKEYMRQIETEPLQKQAL